MSKRNRRGGYSLVEVIIALAIIIIVSVTALSISLSSVATKVNAINLSEAQGFADNVWESFKAAEGESEFEELVRFAESVDLGEGVEDGSGGKVYTYYSEKHKFTAEIAVSYSDVSRDELKLTVTDEDGEDIISFTYKKGDGI